ncbi:MAG: glycosyltransferase [Candidatus Omnitrophica bacterium]|nr:glycosyltransferase [Candidatus Omnitrophota bacterium]MDD5352150.1 glycosyltransferase [Candidatus Omnitrophota bacterium]MDD5549748.1 glycosyltransferase [Candidatus Omnitrophota bacterium]
MTQISVIIPTYNRAIFLKKAMDSVLNQSYQDFELIIVDDGSVDETKVMMKEYENRVKYIYQQNKGPASARNRGIKEAKADFVAFLDSDDWWAKDKLKVQLKAMQDSPDYLISHTQEIWYKNGKVLNQKKKHRKFAGHIFDKCLPICAVGMSTMMVKKELFKKIGLFDEDLPCCEDYDLWLRASVKFPFLLIDKPLTLKQGGRPEQVSSKYAQGIDKFRIYSIKKLLEEDALDNQKRQLAVAELKRKCKIYGEGCIKHNKKEEGKFYLDLMRQYSIVLTIL